MLSMSPPRPRVDEKFPSSAPEPSPRRRGSFVASWCIVAPARGSENAAGAAHAHRVAAHPARRRGEERPHARRHDGVEAPLHHCARHAAAPPAGVALQRFALRLACPVLFFSGRGVRAAASIPCFRISPGRLIRRSRRKFANVPHEGGRVAAAKHLRRELVQGELALVVGPRRGRHA